MLHQLANPKTLVKHFNDIADPNEISYSYALYSDLLHKIDNKEAYILDQKSGQRLEEFDVVYQRRWGDCPEQSMAVTIYLKKHNKIVLDAETERSGSINKMTQHWRLWEAGLPFPSTIFISADYVKDWLKNDLTKTFQLPVVMKSVRASRGRDNYLIHTIDEALRLVQEGEDISYLIQEYIPNDCDYRVWVCGSEIPLVIKRTAAKGSYKNNTSLGGGAELVEKSSLPERALEDSIKAAQAFKRDIAGVDLVFDKNHPDQYYFFEVNRSPQIEASSFTEEKVRALNVYFNSL